MGNVERSCHVSDSSPCGADLPPAQACDLDTRPGLLKDRGLVLLRRARPLGVLGITSILPTPVIFLYFLVGAVSVYAAQAPLAPLSVLQLTHRSEIIVIGEVLLTQSEWNSSRTVISTRVDTHVEEVLKGSVAGRSLSLVQLGGQVGDIGSSVAGTPSFSRGERVLLFLSRRRDGTLGVTSLFQGKFSLKRDRASGREMAIRRVPDSGQILDQIPLDQARFQIRTALGR